MCWFVAGLEVGFLPDLVNWLDAGAPPGAATLVAGGRSAAEVPWPPHVGNH